MVAHSKIYDEAAELIEYPSIGNFKSFIRTLKKLNITLTLSLIGRTKAHGMNVGVLFNVKNGTYSIQTRGTVVSNKGVKDHTGTVAFFKDVNLDRMFDEVRKVLADKYGVIPTDSILIVGERCGGNVQKHVGLTKLDKLFIVFDVFADGKWYSSHISDFVGVESPAENVYHMDRFSKKEDVYILDASKTYDDDFDSNTLPAVIQDATDRVDASCPIVRSLLPDGEGCGEGLVWRLDARSYIELISKGFTDEVLQLMCFKSKGESHLGPPPMTCDEVAAAKAESNNVVSSLLDLYATPTVCSDIILKFNFAPVKTNIKEYGDKFVADVLGSITIDINDEDKKKIVSAARCIAVKFFKNFCDGVQ